MDRRRVTGPELSVPPLRKQVTTKPIVDKSGKRLDGRTIEDIRPIFLKTGLIGQATGSAYIEAGKTKLACAVYGPRPLKRQTIEAEVNCEVKFATFSCEKRRQLFRDPQERELSQLIKQSLVPSIRLELVKKSAIDIYVEVLECDGMASCFAAAVTAASTALADSGIELYDLVTASSLIYANDEPILDATTQEEKFMEGSLILAYMPNLNEITQTVQSGEVSLPKTLQGIDMCSDAASKVYGVMSATLKTSL